MKKSLAAVSIGLCVILAAGCASTPRAPQAAGGARIEIKVLCNRGSQAEMEARQWQWRNEVGAYMERDLINRLRKSGFEAELVASETEFQPGQDRYLLKVSITSYNPGSNAARMLVGFGAGAAALDNKYELLGSDPQPVMAWTDGVGTSEHWSKLPRKLNINTVKRLVQKLNESKR